VVSILHGSYLGNETKVKKAIKKQSKQRIPFYICEINFTSTAQNKTGSSSMTAMVMPMATNLSGSIIIRRRFPQFLESMLRMLMPMSEITNTLPDFAKEFCSFGVSGNVDHLPEFIQKSLVSFNGKFPLDSNRGKNSLVFLTPQGWAIVSPRITSEEPMNQFIETGEKLAGVFK